MASRQFRGREPGFNNFEDALKVLAGDAGNTGGSFNRLHRTLNMKTRFPLLPALLLALLAHGAVQAQTSIDQASAMAGTLPGDNAGFPVVITQPGHYVLTSNLVVPLGVNAIVIHWSAPGVTLDLNGFTVSSSIECSQNSTTLSVNCGAGTAVHDGDLIGKTGIRIAADGVLVRNGSVRGFRGHGVYVGAKNVRVEGLRVFSNRYNGIDSAGVVVHARISDTHVFENGYLERMVASNNDGSGIENTYGLVVDSLVTHNGAYGIRGQDNYGAVGVRGSLVYSNKVLNMGPTAVSMGGNKHHAGTF
jgi:hypothetical protein